MLGKLNLLELEASANQSQSLLAEQPPWVVKTEHLHGAQTSKHARNRWGGAGSGVKACH